LNSDYANATLGNYGVFSNSGNASNAWVSQGTAGYFNFDGSIIEQYIDSNGLTGYVSPNSSYTYFAMVNVTNFGDFMVPGGIVGGDSSVFGFASPFSFIVRLYVTLLGSIRELCN